MITHFTWVR